MGKKLNNIGFVEINNIVYPTYTSEINGIQITTLDYPSIQPIHDPIKKDQIENISKNMSQLIKRLKQK